MQKIVKKLSLTFLIDIFTFNERKDYLSLYYNYQSVKGLQLYKAGLFVNSFIKDDSVRHIYETKQSDEKIDSDDWEFVSILTLNNISIYKRQVSIKAESVKKNFSASEYEEETEWLNNQAKKGLYLVKVNSDMYEFDRYADYPEIEYYIELKPDIKDLDKYIKMNAKKGLNYICKNGNRHYFQVAELNKNIEPDFFQEHIEKIDVKKSKIKAVAFSILLIADLIFMIILNENKAITNDLKNTLNSGSGILMMICICNIFTNYIRLYKVKAGSDKLADLKIERLGNIRSLAITIIVEAVFIFFLLQWVVSKHNIDLVLKIIAIPTVVSLPFYLALDIKEIKKINSKLKQLRSN